MIFKVVSLICFIFIVRNLILSVLSIIQDLNDFIKRMASECDIILVSILECKKEYDKRQTLKEKEDRREMDRAKKHY